jgi:hypothetical protein
LSYRRYGILVLLALLPLLWGTISSSMRLLRSSGVNGLTYVLPILAFAILSPVYLLIVPRIQNRAAARGVRFFIGLLIAGIGIVVSILVAGISVAGLIASSLIAICGFLMVGLNTTRIAATPAHSVGTWILLCLNLCALIASAVFLYERP